MAKRKRLSPARPDFVERPAQGEVPSSSSGRENKLAQGPMEGFAPATSGAVPHRAPIASVAGDASASAALAEMAQTLTDARQGGRMVMELALEKIVSDHLVRDRVVVDEDEMQALVQSLSARGQQTPIEVTALDGERYGLIAGWRRLEALKRLRRETGEDRFGSVLALLRSPSDAADAYLSMVEENEIRVGLSYYERARIAARAVEEGVYADEGKALRELFHAASRPKRSKIRAFLPIVASLDGVLRYPQALGERLGLSLSKALEADPALGPRLRKGLESTPAKSAEEEHRLIGEVLEGKKAAPVSQRKPDASSKKARARELRPGLKCLVKADGSLVLSGPALDEDLRERLQAWLAEGRE